MTGINFIESRANREVRYEVPFAQWGIRNFTGVPRKQGSHNRPVKTAQKPAKMRQDVSRLQYKQFIQTKQ